MFSGHLHYFSYEKRKKVFLDVKEELKWKWWGSLRPQAEGFILHLCNFFKGPANYAYISISAWSHREGVYFVWSSQAHSCELWCSTFLLYKPFLYYPSTQVRLWYDSKNRRRQVSIASTENSGPDRVSLTKWQTWKRCADQIVTKELNASDFLLNSLLIWLQRSPPHT